jgi:hypothetical protein
MGIFLRKRKSTTVYYVTFIWNGKQIQERAGTDKRQAQHLERQRKREVSDGTYRPDRKSGSMTLATYAAQWIELRRRRGLRTVDDDDGRLRLHVLPALGSRRLDSISGATSAVSWNTCAWAASSPPKPSGTYTARCAR